MDLGCSGNLPLFYLIQLAINNSQGTSSDLADKNVVRNEEFSCRVFCTGLRFMTSTTDHKHSKVHPIAFHEGTEWE
jgi:hypothetical protein